MARDYFIFLEVLLLNAHTELNQVEICPLSQTALPNTSNESPWENALVTNSFNLSYQVLNRSETEFVIWDSVLELSFLLWTSLSCSRMSLTPSCCSLTFPLWLDTSSCLSYLLLSDGFSITHNATTKWLSVKLCYKKSVGFGVRFYIFRTVLLMDGKFPGRIVYFQTC